MGSDEEASLKAIKSEHKQIRKRLRDNGQKFVDIDWRRMFGSWSLGYQMVLADERWEEGQRGCNLHLGCCTRDCGYCEEPHKSCTGHYQLLDPHKRSHCFVECGCCIRWRGFRLRKIRESPVKRQDWTGEQFGAAKKSVKHYIYKWKWLGLSWLSTCLPSINEVASTFPSHSITSTPCLQSQIHSFPLQSCVFNTVTLPF